MRPMSGVVRVTITNIKIVCCITATLVFMLSQAFFLCVWLLNARPALLRPIILNIFTRFQPCKKATTCTTAATH